MDTSQWRDELARYLYDRSAWFSHLQAPDDGGPAGWWSAYTQGTSHQVMTMLRALPGISDVQVRPTIGPLDAVMFKVAADAPPPPVPHREGF